MLKKIFFGFVLLILLAITIWINRVEVVVWAIPKIIKFTQPVAEYKEVVWPEGPSDPELPLKERKPNIILILADDLGFNDVSLYNGGAGDGTLMTPNIDRIGKEGVRFNNGYAASASCSPSRASLMTGRYATRFGYEFTPFYSIGRTIFKWIDQIENPLIRTQFAEVSEENFIGDEGYAGMPSSEITIAEVLKQQGYYNAHIGKWHLGDTKGQLPTDQGFDDSLQLLSPLYLPKDDPNVINAYTDAGVDRMIWAASQFSVRFNGGEL